MAPTSLIALCLCSWALAPAAEEGKDAYKLTLGLVWASDEATKDKLPPELEKLAGDLKKTSRKKSFRLDGKLNTQDLAVGQTVTQKLPDGYEAQWTLTRDPKDKDKLVVKQVLFNPKKERSEWNLKRSPVITSLDKIQRGKETLLLVVIFEKGGKKG